MCFLSLTLIIAYKNSYTYQLLTAILSQTPLLQQLR